MKYICDRYFKCCGWQYYNSDSDVEDNAVFCPHMVRMACSEDHLAKFIMENYAFCPFKANCGIDFEKECSGWESGSCKKCLIDNAAKLNLKEVENEYSW